MSTTLPRPAAAAARPGAAPAGGTTTLLDVLGGRRSALDATLPSVAFVVALVVTGRAAPDAVLPVSLAAGTLTALAVAGWRAVRGHQVRAAVLGLLPVLGGAVVAARTGRAEDFFAVRILANAASALAWTGSIWVGRPLLGVVTGSALRQRGAWRADPHLYRGYARASWWWAGSFALRTVVLGALYLASTPVLLGVVQVALSWPLMTSVLVVSWRVLRRALPAGHPGLLHPVAAD
ncbi:MAG: DUF3159 domain-containing protein [Actinobacteria bacterium]|nr:DUF3159 domain-containing protein [Actinomycetota bacterium]